jgi:hypothetical protein
MYLSRSKSVSIWPNLNRKKEGEKILRGIKSSINLSFAPKIDITAKWKGRSDAPVPTRKNSNPWPPWDALSIAMAIEKLLRNSDDVGSMEDFEKGTFEHPGLPPVPKTPS